MLKSCINASPLILLLSISITLNRFLPERTLIKCCAPSLSISLFDKCNSSRLFPLSIKSHIILHPFDVILLLDKLSIVKLCLFLFERALITISKPSSPILFPLMFNSLIVLLKLKQSSKVFIPCNPISFFQTKNFQIFFIFKRLAYSNGSFRKNSIGIEAKFSYIFFIQKNFTYSFCSTRSNKVL